MTATRPLQLSRPEAVRKVHLYNNLTIGWNVVEGVIAIAAGIAAGSISLIAFGLDSGVEVSTSLVLAWRLAQERRGGCMTTYDQRATRLIAICFGVLAVYVGYEAIARLVVGRPRRRDRRRRLRGRRDRPYLASRPARGHLLRLTVHDDHPLRSLRRFVHDDGPAGHGRPPATDGTARAVAPPSRC